MYRGYIKTWRKLLYSDLFKNPKLAHLWQWCLLKASHKDRQQVVGYQIVELKPGQFITGRVKAAQETGLTEKSIRTGLAALRAAKRIKTASNRASAYTLVTVLNWRRYQSDNNAKGQQTGQPAASEGPVNGQPAATNKNVKNVKHGKGEAAAPPASETPDPTATAEAVKGDGAGGRLVKLWIDKFKYRTGQPYSTTATGKLAGIVKALLKGGYSEVVLSTAVDRWFSAGRQGYGVELFKCKMEGADAELTGRGGESCDGDDEQDRRNWAKGEAEKAAASAKEGKNETPS